MDYEMGYWSSWPSLPLQLRLVGVKSGCSNGGKFMAGKESCETERKNSFNLFTMQKWCGHVIYRGRASTTTSPTHRPFFPCILQLLYPPLPVRLYHRARTWNKTLWYPVVFAQIIMAHNRPIALPKHQRQEIVDPHIP